MDSQAAFAQNARRKVLHAALSAILHDSGYGYAERSVLETLVEMLQAFINELGRSSRAYCELCGRTDILVGDVVLALVEMGIDVDSIPAYGKTLLRTSKIIVPAPSQTPRANLPKILQAGEKRPLHSYIPDYLPPFPDPHSYIRTPTHKQPVTEYEAIREKAASQKRDVERALTRFMAKTSDSSSAHSLFPDEHMSNLFPLIALEVQQLPYLASLLPKDQIFEEDEAEEDQPKAESDKAEKPPEDVAETPADVAGNDSQDEGEGAANGQKTATSHPPQTSAEPEVPDNPYLRTAKITKKATQIISSGTMNRRS